MSLLKAEAFAVLLGLESAATSARYPHLNLPQGQELDRFQRVKFHIQRIRSQATEAAEDELWSEFCALYLPTTVDQLLDLPTPIDAQTEEDRDMVPDFIANNPWHEILVCVQHIPYLAQYLRCTKPVAVGGKRLPQVLADRLADISARWETRMTTPANTPHARAKRQFYMDAAGAAVQLLSTLCTHCINNSDRNAVISLATQQRLLPILTIWSHRYNGQFLGDVSLRMVAFMSKTLDRDFKTIRKLIKNWDVCGLPSCNVRKNLKTCARCHTVRYCSPDHQKADWATANGIRHQKICFEIAYK
ncbi:hypothetical protein DFH06DRAFT_1338356 [Mycena polygramma]|nr:hypothetical protein DFH06DRAFT_1338356 [Mycena polygramma]